MILFPYNTLQEEYNFIRETLFISDQIIFNIIYAQWFQWFQPVKRIGRHLFNLIVAEVAARGIQE